MPKQHKNTFDSRLVAYASPHSLAAMGASFQGKEGIGGSLLIGLRGTEGSKGRREGTGIPTEVKVSRVNTGCTRQTCLITEQSCMSIVSHACCQHVLRFKSNLLRRKSAVVNQIVVQSTVTGRLPPWLYAVPRLTSLFVPLKTVICSTMQPLTLLLLLLLLLHPFNGLFFRTTWVSQYQKGETCLDLNVARDDGVWGCSGISWTICKQSAPHSRQITTPAPLQSIFPGRMVFLTTNQQCQSTEGKVQHEART